MKNILYHRKWLLWTNLWILMSWVNAPYGHAQSIGISNAHDTIRSQYVTDFERRCMIRAYLSNSNLSFNLRNQANSRQFVSYTPNVQYVIGVGAFYEKLGVEVGLKLPVSDATNQRYGYTRTFDLQTNYYGNSIGGDAIYQRHQGFYINNPIIADTAWLPRQNYPYRPDITTRLLGGNAYYVFNNRRFSYRAAFVQTERQVESAGSFILMSSLTHLRVFGDYSLVPAHFEEASSFRRGGIFHLAVMPGYAYTFVRGRSYASISLLMGGGLQQKRFVIDDEWQSQWSLARRNSWRLAAGYFGETINGGASLIINHTPAKMQNLSLSASVFNVRIFVGYRFNSGKIDRLVAEYRRKIEVLYRKAIR